MMSEETSKRTVWGKWLLAAALLAAGIAVGVSLNRGNGNAPAVAGAGQLVPGAADPIENLRRRTVDSPDDAAAWLALGDALFARGDFAEAVGAFDKATVAAPGTARGWSALGEARVMASAHEPMPPAALAAFRQSAALDPKDPRARYFLAVQRDLDGDHRGAIADWLALLGDTPPGAPWESDLRRTIEQVGTINKIGVAAQLAAIKPSAPLVAQAIPGPSAADLKAATAIPPGEQRTMAEAMVARLDARLKTQPNDVAGWTMLMRSRMTLGQPEKAAEALRAALAENPARAAQTISTA